MLHPRLYLFSYLDRQEWLDNFERKLVHDPSHEDFMLESSNQNLKTLEE